VEGKLLWFESGPLIQLTYSQDWCARIGFPPGGRYQPGDWVDEGKLLLFIKEEVASRPPHKGPRLTAEKKRRAGVSVVERAVKRQRGPRGVAAGLAAAYIVEGDDDEDCSDLLLMYNTVRSYISAINELWSHQTSRGLHNAAQPQRVAMKALKTSIIRGEHNRRRTELTDRGIATVLDGYTAVQIPDLNRQVWAGSLGAGVEEQSLRTQLDFLLGNSMLLRLSNRLPMELADVFYWILPKEGPNGDGWCVIAVMDQGKSSLFCLLYLLLIANYI
jgi:hypothetical protein